MIREAAKSDEGIERPDAAADRGRGRHTVIRQPSVEGRDPSERHAADADLADVAAPFEIGHALAYLVQDGAHAGAAFDQQGVGLHVDGRLALVESALGDG